MNSHLLWTVKYSVNINYYINHFILMKKFISRLKTFNIRKESGILILFF